MSYFGPERYTRAPFAEKFGIDVATDGMIMAVVSSLDELYAFWWVDNNGEVMHMVKE
jgi:hypothetical protein